jgi:hypothetical protein
LRAAVAPQAVGVAVSEPAPTEGEETPVVADDAAAAAAADVSEPAKPAAGGSFGSIGTFWASVLQADDPPKARTRLACVRAGCCKRSCDCEMYLTQRRLARAQVVVVKGDYKFLGVIAAPMDNYFRITGAPRGRGAALRARARAGTLASAALSPVTRTARLRVLCVVPSAPRRAPAPRARCGSSVTRRRRPPGPAAASRQPPGRAARGAGTGTGAKRDARCAGCCRLSSLTRPPRTCAPRAPVAAQSVVPASGRSLLAA